MLAAFSGFLLWRILVGDNSSCHCFGELADVKPAWSLVKNAVLAGLLALGWKADFRSDLKVWHVLAVGVLVAATVFITNPCDTCFGGRSAGSHSAAAGSLDRPVQTEISISDWEKIAPSLPLAGRRIVCLYSTGCKFCANCAAKMAGIIRHVGIPSEQVLCIFLALEEDMSDQVTEFYKEKGGGLVLPYTVMEAYAFLHLTNGKMPVVLLCEDGRIIREYDFLGLDEEEIAGFMME